MFVCISNISLFFKLGSCHQSEMVTASLSTHPPPPKKNAEIGTPTYHVKWQLRVVLIGNHPAILNGNLPII